MGPCVCPEGLKGYRNSIRISTLAAGVFTLQTQALTKAEASTTRRPTVPRTFRSGIRDAVSSFPIATEPTGWSNVSAFLRMYTSSASSVVAFANSPNSLMM